MYSNFIIQFASLFCFSYMRYITSCRDRVTPCTFTKVALHLSVTKFFVTLHMKIFFFMHYYKMWQLPKFYIHV